MPIKKKTKKVKNQAAKEEGHSKQSKMKLDESTTDELVSEKASHDNEEQEKNVETEEEINNTQNEESDKDDNEVMEKNDEEKMNTEEANIEEDSITNEKPDNDPEVEEKNNKAKEKVFNKRVEDKVDVKKALALNFDNIQFVDIKDKSKNSCKRPSALSIVNNDNGYRLVLGFDESKHVGFPKKLQIGFLENQIAIAEKFPNNKNSFTAKRSTNKRKLIIYNKELVEYITKLYGLDFSNRTTVSFYDAEYTNIDETPVVLIKIKEDE